MNTSRLVSTLVLAGALTGALVPQAAVADTTTQAAVSANWSGYEVGGTAGNANQQFSSVSASWIEPSVDCSTGQGDAAFWIGLGGAGQQSQSLEQVGTEADCNAGAAVDHFAWYELVPAAPVRLSLAISPGDHVSGNVTVAGTNVTVSLSDHTTGAAATKVLQMSDPDVSSAEWISEAPSSCDGSGSCQPVPLAGFGTVNFSNASATANGHTGTISDANWTAQPVQLSAGGSATGYAAAAPVSDQSSPDAAPSALSADGSSFSVTTLSPGSQSSGSGATGAGSGSAPGDGGYTYSDGSPYGDGYRGYGYGGPTG